MYRRLPTGKQLSRLHDMNDGGVNKVTSEFRTLENQVIVPLVEVLTLDGDSHITGTVNLMRVRNVIPQGP